ncbi:MAG: UvrD-helicase domain-containing protein, partial [Pseudomonadota bacterium]
IAQKNFCHEHLLKQQTRVFSALIDSHKQREIRTEEWSILLIWLLDKSESTLFSPMPKEAVKVFSAVRFPKKDADLKQTLIDLFEPVKQLKLDATAIEQRIEQAKIYQLARQGIILIREKISQAKKQQKVMNYDDLIHQLANKIVANKGETTDEFSQQNSEQALFLASQIRASYPVALVDEFQDTDPQQYAILKAIYLNSPNSFSSSPETKTALYMIGDPKQAIYAFRSGDVFTYLAARNDADQLWFMDTNWRSSTAMVKAYNRLFYGADLDQDATDVFGFDIKYIPIKAAGQADKQPLNESSSDKSKNNNSAMELIYFPFNEDYRSGKGQKLEMKQDFCEVIAHWCSYEIHRLLTEQIRIGDNPLQEQDIAILVRDKKEAAYIQNALSQINYASVYLSSHENVFYSEQAKELIQVLNSLLQLENDQLLIAGLATRFFGCDTEQLAAMQSSLMDDLTADKQTDNPDFEYYRQQMFDLRELWIQRGFMAMALKLLHKHYKPQPYFFERALTNIIHLFELLQIASQQHKQPEQLINWFDEQIRSANVSAEAELRLESDANLIRIITQHGAKGLEYPVVFIPFSTRYKDPAKFGNKNIELFKYHHPETGLLNYFIGKDKNITELYRKEAWAENIRLLYVAITRAVHRCYLCVTPFSHYQHSPLGLTLKLNAEDNLEYALQALIQKPDSAINLQTISAVDFPVEHQQQQHNRENIQAATFSGFIERNWWLSSFSALSRNLRHGGISRPDRDDFELAEPQPEADLNTVEQMRFSLRKGAATGNLLHDILEQTDFNAPQWQRVLQYPLARYSENLEPDQQQQLIDWLESCLATELAEGLQLQQLICSATLRETEFYFPMTGVSPEDLSLLLSKHRLQQAQKQGLEHQPKGALLLPGKRQLKGMMHGFIDLIFYYQGQYFLVDYKSTHLGDHLDCYSADLLLQNISDNYYDLQYLIYSLALHRYLKARIADYDPEIHFGGVYYLYLRGMSKKSNTGVFFASMSTELLQQLDDLFSTSEVAEDTQELL